MENPVIATVDKSHCLGHWRNVYFQIWRNDVTLERNQRMRAECRRFLEKTQGPVGGVIIVESKCPLPDDKCRQEAVGWLKDLHERGKGVVLVFEGDGFLAAASRAVMVTLLNISRSPYPYKITANTADADTFMSSVLPGQWSPGELAAALEAARNRITEAGAVGASV